MPTELLAEGFITKPIDADAAAAPVTGRTICLPRHNNHGNSLTWRISYASAPSAVVVKLQGSLDDVDANYVNMDESTLTTGETRTVNPIIMNFMRPKVTAKTGGGAITVEFMLS